MAPISGFFALAVVLVAAVPGQITARTLTRHVLIRKYINKHLLPSLPECENQRSGEVKGINQSSNIEAACAFTHYLGRVTEYHQDLNPNANITKHLNDIKKQFSTEPLVVRECKKDGSPMPDQFENPSGSWEQKDLSCRVLISFERWLKSRPSSLWK